MDSGITYFGRMDHEVVIVRGDRPDIQLAALSTPIRCLVLTGGHQPSQYVYYQAQEREVPVLLVKGDTASTARVLESLMEHSTCHHPGKVHRFQELLQRHADVSAIKAALGVSGG